MPRDKGLETQINEDLGGRKGITEKPMFGGLAWLLDSKLLLGARHLGMLARIGEANEKWALKVPASLRWRCADGQCAVGCALRWMLAGTMRCVAN